MVSIIITDNNNNSGDEWEIRVMGWAFAHNPASTRRKLIMGLARTVAGISRANDPVTADNLESRLGYFFARNVRDQHFTVEVVGTSRANHMGIDADDPNPAEEQHLPADTMVPPSPRTPSASSDRTLFDHTGRGYDDDPFGETVAYVGGGEEEARDLLKQEIEDASADLADLNIAAQEPQSRRHHHHHHHHHHYHLRHRHDKKSLPDEESNIVTINSTAALDPKSDYFNHLPVPTIPSVSPSSNTSTSSTTPISSTNITPASSTASIMTTASTSASLATATTGHFSGMLRVPTALVNEWGREQAGSNRPRLLKIRAFSGAADAPSYGLVSLIEPTGVSVISDIDDTIKDTQVLAGVRVVLSNTFLSEAKEVPQMAE
ncbi:hypothetical protein BC937DRAFT_87106, partial [Endogone sp. FLAS-F59071]